MLSFIVPAYNEEHELPGTLAAIRAAAAAPKRAIQLTWSTAKPDWLDVEVPAGTEKQAARVFLAVTEDGLSTKVTRGEV